MCVCVCLLFFFSSSLFSFLNFICTAAVREVDGLGLLAYTSFYLRILLLTVLVASASKLVYVV